MVAAIEHRSRFSLRERESLQYGDAFFGRDQNYTPNRPLTAFRCFVLFLKRLRNPAERAAGQSRAKSPRTGHSRFVDNIYKRGASGCERESSNGLGIANTHRDRVSTRRDFR